MNIEMHLLLIGNCQISLSSRNHFGWHGCICRGDDFHIKTRILEVTKLVGHDDRPMIRVHIPVEYEFEFIVRVSCLS
ncbi:hypothetical protein D3C79_1052530 [compost metagenome]